MANKDADINFQLSEKDLKVLSVVHPTLERIVKRAAEETEVPFVVFEGVRTLARQKQLKRKGASKTLKSRHLEGFAVDLVPIIDGKIVWDVEGTRVIAAAMFKASADLGFENKIRWGGTWRTDAGTTEDMRGREDGSFNRFYDGPHFELSSRYYTTPAKRTRDYLASRGTGTPPSRMREKTIPGSKFNGRIKTVFAESVQRALVEFGIPVTIDGFYGDGTREGVAKLQEALKVHVDGLWGPGTSKAYHAWKQRRAEALRIEERNKRLDGPPPTQAPVSLMSDASPVTNPIVSDDKSSRPIQGKDAALQGASTEYDKAPPKIDGPEYAQNNKGSFTMDGKKTYIVAGIVLLLAVVEGVLGYDIPGVDIAPGDVINYVLSALGLGALGHKVDKARAGK